MKTVIFGAGGQLGRALRATLPENVAAESFPEEELDICSPNAVAAAIEETKPDIVINAAAYTAVDKAESETDTAFHVNAEAPGHIAQACNDVGARLVHVSTDYVFDGTGERPYRPDDPTGPVSVYGRSKLAGEEAVQAILPDALIVRTAWVYAAGGANFVVTMLRLMAERDELNVVADQIGAPTHADSLARALWALVGNEAQGVFHYTDAGETSWHGFAMAIEEQARAMGMIDGCTVHPITTAEYPTPAARPAMSLLDCTATYAITGPAKNWRDELRNMLDQQKALS
ncbi:dTDP-4-dehydrorhamnose reductase [Parasphingopyxis sp.]|uniref:dTDP-4-dehydrorhamnose reductase n=1 Tax=Parasphingopyxis sp. TaxID=1920299 RepID=UPI0026386D6D|nr:dTDP-4-dehydrorhamnose reductase [Parasphingopyxis sp.]